MAHDLHDYLRLLLDFLKSGKSIAAVWILFFGTGAYTVIDLIPEDKPSEPEITAPIVLTPPATKQDPVALCRKLLSDHIADLH